MHDQVEVQIGFRAAHLDGDLGQILDDARDLLLIDRGDNLEPCVGVARDDARRRSCLDALEPAGVGHDRALGVFDDAAAHLKLQTVGDAARDLAGARGGERDGDGLGASHRGNQLLLQNRDVGAIAAIGLIHAKANLPDRVRQDVTGDGPSVTPVP